MSGPTPGPWAVNPLCAQVDEFSTGQPLPVCQLLWPTDKRGETETEANARFIAASPQVADALFNLLSLLGELPLGEMRLDQPELERFEKACDAASAALIASGRVMG